MVLVPTAAYPAQQAVTRAVGTLRAGTGGGRRSGRGLDLVRAGGTSVGADTGGVEFVQDGPEGHVGASVVPVDAALLGRGLKRGPARRVVPAHPQDQGVADLGAGLDDLAQRDLAQQLVGEVA